MKLRKIMLTVLLSLFAVSVMAMPSDIREHKQEQAHHAAKPIVLVTGSLRDNVTRIAAEYGWHKVVWQPDHDYRWVGRVSLQPSSMQSVFTRILEGYPLQAVFYKGNHVLVIKARNR